MVSRGPDELSENGKLRGDELSKPDCMSRIPSYISTFFMGKYIMS